jgi:hypothetical protein
MTKNFNGYEFFNEVRNPNLRSYNRVNTFLNIRERHGPVIAHRYLEKFDRASKISMFKMVSDMATVGFENYRRSFMRTLNA